MFAKISGFRRYKTEKHSIKFSNHHWDLDLEHSHPIFSQDTSAYDAVPSIIKLSLDAKESTVQKLQKKQPYFDSVSPCSDLDLEDSKEIFLTLWLMAMHHHNKSGYKSLNHSENNIWANIQWHSEPSLWPWPWPQQSNVFTRYTS